jgi:queuine/archaeosine tRNA-ribosyltransferase
MQAMRDAIGEGRLTAFSQQFFGRYRRSSPSLSITGEV